MKIVQVLLSPRVGGAEILAESLSREWNELGHASETIYLDDSTNGGSKISRLFELKRKFMQLKPDVVVSHSALPNVYARLAAYRRLPVVTVLHSATDDFSIPSLRFAEAILRFRTSCVVAVSHDQLNSYIKRFGSRVRTTVIPNGARSTNTPARNSALEATKVVTLSRVASQKNPALWIEAVRQVSETHPKLGFEWWGPAEANTTWSQVIEDHNAGGRPGYFAGATNEPEKVLTETDILFHPSDSEAHSISIIEAASAGIPVVCSSSVAATLAHPISVVVFAVGDASDAARALSATIKDWVKYKNEAQRLAPELQRAFSTPECARHYVELLESITLKL